MTAPIPPGRISPPLIAFQGARGAYSDLACRTVYPGVATLPRKTFEDAFAAVRDGAAGMAMIPIDNTVAGRVADIHHLMPNSGLHIVGEHFQRVEHHLLVSPGARAEDLRTVHSHVHALSQCRGLIARLGVTPVVAADTAGAAAELAESRDRTVGVIASSLAAETYGLESIDANIEDAEHNTTRFVLMTREAVVPPADEPRAITSLLFRVRSVPASLYKALGGFATNGVNMLKLESYLTGPNFDVAQFFADIDGHPETRSVRLALEELDFFSREVRILGVYPANPYRSRTRPGEDD